MSKADDDWKVLSERLRGRGDFLLPRGRIKDAELMFDAAAEIADLRRQLEDARKDAERWRWISEQMTHEKSGPNYGWTLSTLMPGDDPEAAIDAAMKDAP